MKPEFHVEENVYNLWKLKPEPHITSAPLKVRISEVACRRFKIMRNGELSAVYILPVEKWLNYAYAWRPYIHPFYSPKGLPLVQHNPPDHLHHRGIWIGHGEVNGEEFFVEQEDAGRIATRGTKVVEEGARVVLEQHNQWLNSMGTPLLEEDRRLIFSGDDTANIVDHEVTLWPAGAGPVVMGPTIHGFFSVRTEERLELRGGGHLLNSLGDKEGHAGGKVCRWIDACGIVGGQRCGIAVYNFPQNPAQPMIASDFGWISAHPFWQTAHTLKPGKDRCRLAFRVVGHDGWPEEIDLNQYCP